MMNKNELNKIFNTPQQVEFDKINDSTYVVTLNGELINRQVAVYKSVDKLILDINDYYTIRNHIKYMINNHPNELFKYNGKYYFTV